MTIYGDKNEWKKLKLDLANKFKKMNLLSD